MRGLKHHEKKLLRKVDFLKYGSTHACPFGVTVRAQMHRILIYNNNIFFPPRVSASLPFSFAGGCRQDSGAAREVPILRKYHIQKREDYTKYNRMCGLGKIKVFFPPLLYYSSRTR